MNKNYQNVESLVTLTYNGKMIGFLLSSDVMVNATEMAKMFCSSKEEYMLKRPTIWLRSKEAKEYIQMLIDVRKMHINDIVRSEKSGVNGQKGGGGTWMNRRLAIAYAHWLDIQFGDWIYSKIEELIYNGQTIMNTVINPLQTENQQLKQDNQNLQNQINSWTPKVNYYDQVLQNPEPLYSTNQIIKQLGIKVSNRDLINRMITAGLVYRDPSDNQIYVVSKYNSFRYRVSTTIKDSTGKYRSVNKWTEAGKQWLYSLAMGWRLI